MAQWTPLNKCENCGQGPAYKSYKDFTSFNWVFECLNCYWKYLIPGQLTAQTINTNNTNSLQQLAGYAQGGYIPPSVWGINHTPADINNVDFGLDIKGNTMSPSNTKFNTQLTHSTARLAPMWKEIHKEFFHEGLDFSF